jgi:hypothetical protein
VPIGSCAHCNARLAPGSAFCTECGADFVAEFVRREATMREASSAPDRLAEQFRGFCEDIWGDRFINPKEMRSFHEDFAGLGREEKFRIAADVGIPRFMLQEQPAGELFEMHHEQVIAPSDHEIVTFEVRLALPFDSDRIDGAGEFERLRVRLVLGDQESEQPVNIANLDFDRDALENSDHARWNYIACERLWQCQVQAKMPGPGRHPLYVLVGWDFSDGHFAFVSCQPIVVVVQSRGGGQSITFREGDRYAIHGDNNVQSVSNHGSSAGAPRGSATQRFVPLEFRPDRLRNKAWRPRLRAPQVSGAPDRADRVGVRVYEGGGARTVVLHGPKLTMGGAWDEGLLSSIPLAPFKDERSFRALGGRPGEFISRRQLEWRVDDTGLHVKNVGLAIVEFDGLRLQRDEERRIVGEHADICLRIDRRKGPSMPGDEQRRIGLAIDVRPWEASRGELDEAIARSGGPAPELAGLAARSGIRCLVITRDDGLADIERYVWVIGHARLGSGSACEIPAPREMQLHFAGGGAWLLADARTLQGVRIDESVAGVQFDDGAVTVTESGLAGGAQ